MNNQEPTKSRRGLAVGLTAGLIGGTAAGLVLGVPGLSGATNDGPAAGIVAQVDDPAPVDDPVAPGDPAPDREPGDRIREVLQELVDDGTLTPEQADAVTAHLVENRPERDGRGGPGHHGPGHHGPRFDDGVVTELLGIDAETLRTELRGGATLVEIAAANDVSEQALVDALVAQATERIDQAVVDGKLDAAAADEMKADLEARITARVNGERPERPGLPGAPADED